MRDRVGGIILKETLVHVQSPTAEKISKFWDTEIMAVIVLNWNSLVFQSNIASKNED